MASGISRSSARRTVFGPSMLRFAAPDTERDENIGICEPIGGTVEVAGFDVRLDCRRQTLGVDPREHRREIPQHRMLRCRLLRHARRSWSSPPHSRPGR